MVTQPKTLYNALYLPCAFTRSIELIDKEINRHSISITNFPTLILPSLTQR